jgi:hypothetical protein
MSTNIDLVKEVTDGYSKGIIAFTDTLAWTGIETDGTYRPVITLDSESSPSLAMTVDANRYVKVTFVTPGITLASNGDEDETYSWRLINNTVHAIEDRKQEWFFGIEGGDIIVADDDITPKNVAKAGIGGGTFTMMFDTGPTGWTANNLGIYLGRTGAGTMVGYKPVADASGITHQLFAEDCGSSVIS